MRVGSRVRVLEIERVADCQVTEARELPDDVVGSPLVRHHRCSGQDVGSNQGRLVGLRVFYNA